MASNRYVIIVDYENSPIATYLVINPATLKHAQKIAKDLDGAYSNCKIAVCTYTEAKIPKSSCSKSRVPKHQPRSITHPVKEPMRSSAEWLKDNERTAVCNVCGVLGPAVPMNAEGNSILRKAGWHKEETGSGAFAAMWGMGQPQYELRCPACNEQEVSKHQKEDWF